MFVNNDGVCKATPALPHLLKKQTFILKGRQQKVMHKVLKVKSFIIVLCLRMMAAPRSGLALEFEGFTRTLKEKEWKVR